MRLRSTERVPLLLIALLVLAIGATAGTDPGLEIDVDRATFSLHARDLADGADGPRLPIALGSPSHPTPPGEYRPELFIRNPRWIPGRVARALGAIPTPPSTKSPLGVGKIPLAGGIQLHGGAHPLELGKPVSLGCVAALDEHLLALVAWLEDRAALDPLERRADGELHRRFVRPVRVIVH